MIFVEPFGGLANRLRVIASVLNLSVKTDEKIKLVWVNNSDLNCDFLDLFKPIQNIEVINHEIKYNFLMASIQNHPFIQPISRIVNSLLHIDFFLKEKDFNKTKVSAELSITDLIAIKSEHKHLYIRTCQEIKDQENYKYYSYFRPTDQIETKIDSITRYFDNNTFGIHIRRTDNINSIKYSPTSLFIEQIKFELSLNTDSNFFLATDDKKIEEELKKIFNHKILTHDNEISRSTKKGVIDAVVDLYCLSKTRYIYGSFWSSFSNIAAKIGGIDVVTLKTDD